MATVKAVMAAISSAACAADEAANAAVERALRSAYDCNASQPHDENRQLVSGDALRNILHAAALAALTVDYEMPANALKRTLYDIASDYICKRPKTCSAPASPVPASLGMVSSEDVGQHRYW